MNLLNSIRKAKKVLAETHNQLEAAWGKGPTSVVYAAITAALGPLSLAQTLIAGYGIREGLKRLHALPENRLKEIYRLVHSEPPSISPKDAEEQKTEAIADLLNETRRKPGARLDALQELVNSGVLQKDDPEVVKAQDQLAQMARRRGG
jgi:hypothetical protein